MSGFVPLLPDLAHAGGGAAVLAGTTTIFCVGAADAAGALVAVVVDVTLPTLVLGAVDGVWQPGG